MDVCVCEFCVWFGMVCFDGQLFYNVRMGHRQTDFALLLNSQDYIQFKVCDKAQRLFVCGGVGGCRFISNLLSTEAHNRDIVCTDPE